MRLLCLENTHNRGGGKVWPLAELQAVCAAAQGLGLKLHLDGARLWNAAVALGVSPAVLAAPFDTVAVCLSKGLGAPAGSLLCGSEATIEKARRFRRMYGGSMRQAGILGAAGLYALEHHYEKLAVDHAHARQLAEGLAGLAGVGVRPPETNIVLFDVHPPLPDAEQVVRALQAHGLLGSAFGPRQIRLVTHLDVDRAACQRAVEVLRQVLCA
jgi:threonine aldolase